MKRLFAFFLCLLALTSAAFAEVPKALPHYFPEGLRTQTEPAAQFATYLEAMRATTACQSVLQVPQFNVRSIKEKRVIFGKEVTFNFDLWTREADGKIYFTDFCGRKQITEAQWEFARDDLIQHYIDGVKAAYAYYGHVEQDAVAAIAKSEKKSEADVRKDLAANVPELAHLSPPVTFRELRQMPEGSFTEANFVQKEVHFVYAQYFGAVYLNTELVYLTLQGRILDHVIGKPVVVMHELIHGNEQLQDLVFADALDFELLASPHMMLMPDDMFSVIFHGYAGTFRDQMEVLFGFNFTEARKEIIKFRGDGMNPVIDAKKFDELATKLQAAKKALYEFYRDKAIPELYRNKIFWASVNNKMGDTRAVFKILSMAEFDPTLLDGHEKTMEWLSVHEPEIREMSEKAYADAGKDDGSVSIKVGGPGNLMPLARMLGLDNDALLRLAKKYHIDPSRLTGVSTDDALDVILPVLRAEEKARFGREKENLR